MSRVVSSSHAVSNFKFNPFDLLHNQVITIDNLRNPLSVKGGQKDDWDQTSQFLNRFNYEQNKHVMFHITYNKTITL